MPKPQVVLVRHGETEWSKDGRHTGTTDIPLTEHGRDEARHLRPILQQWQFALVLSSPLQRALDT
ncbi:MAG TPA: histidine phosphatase family protein, partial [Candidatus Dormibacteraeota bacterium]|nr:histidine phosphatase family protein [Candidatus Dormibacteraeota bacterium]